MFDAQPEIPVLIVDDNPEVRRALRLLCEQALGMGVVDELDSLGRLLEQLEILDRGVILFDWELAQDTDEAREVFHRLHKVVRSFIVVLGTQSGTRSAAIAAGADAFIYKGDAPDHLVNLLQAFKNTRRL